MPTEEPFPDYQSTIPEGHWGFPMVEEIPPLLPLHNVTLPSVEASASPPQHFLSEDHLNLIMDIRRDMVDQIFHQECLNHWLDLLFEALSGDQPPTVVHYVVNLSIWPQLGLDTLMAARETTHWVHDFFGFSLVPWLFRANSLFFPL
jgi:hypothetical protein